jgi:predicted ATPase
MTKLFSFSGVHGSGKTTVINDLANRLTNIGERVFVLQEFPYIPNIQIGTIDFQAWYQNAMKQRNKVVDRLSRSSMEGKLFDVILLDRHPLDVDVYSSRLFDERIPKVNIPQEVKTMHHAYKDSIHRWVDYDAVFLLERPIKDIIASLEIRREKEKHRKAWGEEDVEYLKYIIETFRIFKENPMTIFIDNKVLSDSKDLVFDHVVRRIRDE